MEHRTKSQLLITFGRDNDGIAVVVNGRASISEIEAAMLSLMGTLFEFWDFKENKISTPIKLSYEQMIEEE